MRRGNLGPLWCPVTGNASLTCILLFSYKLWDTKLRTFLLISLRSFPGSKTAKATRFIQSEYSLCICMHRFSSLVSDLDRRDRQDVKTFEKRKCAFVLAWANRVNSFGLRSPQNRCDIGFINHRANGEDERHPKGGRTTEAGGTLSTKRYWNQWWLQLWTVGTSQIFLHVRAQLLGHTLSHVMGG